MSNQIRPRLIIIAALLSVISLLLIPACAPAPGGTNLPPPEQPEKGNPKLDSFLNQLILAEKRGEAESFARQRGVELMNGDVRVVIECVPGQVEKATRAATAAGARIETSFENLLQAQVPITSLTALAEVESIRFIRLPERPLPATSN